jgi:phosphohistidine swiveling domain-containing protein
MTLNYIQRKSAVSSILWILGCGLGMTYYSIKKVYAGFNLGNTIWLCRKGEGFLCGDKDTFLDKLVINFQAYIIKHPKHADNVQKIYLSRVLRFSDFINNRLATYDYSKASNKILWRDYQKIVKGYQEVYSYSEPLAIAIGNLSDKIKDEFTKKGLSGDQFEKILLPAELSFVQKEQRAFLKIALNNKGRAISPATLKKLRQHHRQYTWLPYDYGVTAYSLAYFRDQLKAVLKKGRSEIKKKCRNLENYSKNLKKEQGIIIKKFKVSPRQQSLINIIRIAFYLVDSKKELFTRCHWYAERLFLEISRRWHIPLRLMRYALPEEVYDFLNKNKKVNISKLRARYDNCVVKIKRTGSVNILSGQKAKMIIDGFLAARRQPSSSADLKGRIANPGLARGQVRVILDANKCNTFQHGEILVTAMTSPDYMPAVRRAAAIITDEGSVTCHAAIISRELGLPCIIGTKIGTQVLKDGDLVEVDAAAGVVRIIKKK